MNRPTDRNLLFGILAVQRDFITRDALIAIQAWLLDKEKPWGQILVERGDLSPPFLAHPWDSRGHSVLIQ